MEVQKQVVSENLKKKIFQIFWRFDKTTQKENLLMDNLNAISRFVSQ